MQMKSYATNEIVRNKWNCTQQMKSYATNEYTTTLHTDIVFFFSLVSLQTNEMYITSDVRLRSSYLEEITPTY